LGTPEVDQLANCVKYQVPPARFERTTPGLGRNAPLWPEVAGDGQGRPFHRLLQDLGQQALRLCRRPLQTGDFAGPQARRKSIAFSAGQPPRIEPPKTAKSARTLDLSANQRASTKAPRLRLLLDLSTP
jgi:hypothetical protein